LFRIFSSHLRLGQNSDSFLHVFSQHYPTPISLIFATRYKPDNISPQFYTNLHGITCQDPIIFVVTASQNNRWQESVWFTVLSAVRFRGILRCHSFFQTSRVPAPISMWCPSAPLQNSPRLIAFRTTFEYFHNFSNLWFTDHHIIHYDNKPERTLWNLKLIII
jgi:hypothetical protein